MQRPATGEAECGYSMRTDGRQPHCTELHSIQRHNTCKRWAEN